MNHRLLLPLTLSAALHATILAAVLASRTVEEERAAFTVEVVWGEAAGSQGASQTAAAASGSNETSAVSVAHPSRRDFAEREIARPDVPSVVPPQPLLAESTGQTDVSIRAEPAAIEAPVPSRETTETARSSRRRQVVAARPVESKSAESREESGAAASAASAASENPPAPGDRASGASLADASDPSASGASGAAERGGEAVHRVEPGYPLAARRRGLEGTVVLRVRFDAEGRPEDVVVKTGSGSEMLDRAAHEAVQRWRFRGGAAGTVDVPVTFRLRGGDAVQITDARTGKSQ